MIDNRMLYGYQKEVLESSSKNYLYPLDTGTGKTLIGLHHYLKYAEGKKLLIVAPAAKVKEKGWEREITKITEYYQLSPIIYQIISYESLHKVDVSDLSNTYIIFDECHYAKNYKAKRSKLALKISRLAYGFVLLSATPASNGWIDTVNYFVMMGLYPNSTRMLRENAIYEEQYFGITKVRKIASWKNERLLKALFNRISSRALKKEECLELPGITFEWVHFKESKAYRTIKKDRIYENELYDTMSKLIAGLRLNTNMQDKLNYLKMLKESTEDNILIFYNFEKEYEEISKILKVDYVVKGGKYNIPEHSEFKKIKNTVTLVQIQAGAAGIELQYCNTVIFFTPTWSYQNYEQALGRAFRNGQKNKVTVYRFRTDRTIEEDVYEALEQKKDFTEQLFLRKLGDVQLKN